MAADPAEFGVYIWHFKPDRVDFMEGPGDSQIKDLYPHLSELERSEAEKNLEQYLSLVLRIFERIESEDYAQADQLTHDVGTLACTPPESGSSA